MINNLEELEARERNIKSNYKPEFKIKDQLTKPIACQLTYEEWYALDKYTKIHHTTKSYALRDILVCGLETRFPGIVDSVSKIAYDEESKQFDKLCKKYGIKSEELME